MNNVHNEEELTMVKKETLLLLAGLVWGAAGFNILRIGLLAYPGHVTLWNLALSALVFGLFQGMVVRKAGSAAHRAHTGVRHGAEVVLAVF